MRTWDDSGRLIGRAWVQPLNAELQPTHDAENAHAYVVFNGYGTLEGYTAARIVAHLASKSYKRIRYAMCAEGAYVNGETGYLVADEATCAAISEVMPRYDSHECHDAAYVSYLTPACEQVAI